MADRLLVLDARREGYCIGWWLEEDDDIGATIGDGYDYKTFSDEAIREKTEEDDRLHNIAGRTLEKLSKDPKWSVGMTRDHEGFRFDSRAKAREALRLIKAEFKAFESKTPYPEWAVKALAAGWKAPKGWKP